MREKLATLPLTQLKELAKSQGIRNISGLRKAELIDRLCEAAESAGGAKVPAENNENRENTAAPMQAAAQNKRRILADFTEQNLVKEDMYLYFCFIGM